MTAGPLQGLLLRTMRRDDGTAVQVIGYPSVLSRTPATYRIAPQRHGQDTDAVLMERLGLDAAEPARLRQAGVIASAQPPSSPK